MEHADVVWKAALYKVGGEHVTVDAEVVATLRGMVGGGLATLGQEGKGDEFAHRILEVGELVPESHERQVEAAKNLQRIMGALVQAARANNNMVNIEIFQATMLSICPIFPWC